MKKKTKEEEDYGPPLKHFICETCKSKRFDMNLYFYGIESKKCLWCIKYPKTKTKRTFTTQ